VADLHSLNTRSRTTPGRKLPNNNKSALEPNDKPPRAGTVTTISGETEPAIEKNKEIKETIASKSKRLRQFHLVLSDGISLEVQKDYPYSFLDSKTTQD
jgi:hypothetical protein